MKSEFDTLKCLAAPARRALASAGYTRIADLANATEAEVGKLHGMGPNALRILRDALAVQGLTFRVVEL
ncbi:MAG TPA: hypothetical protein VGK19_03255 [Capsulimonadaceae bacterium]|jgi:predicted flap endonuclease-1-like 5' DNA nuclease